MPSNADTTIEWITQLAMVRKRFEAALRAGETIDGLDPWLSLVPEQYRDRLRKELEHCQHIICPSSIETQVLASDAAMSPAMSSQELLFNVGDLDGAQLIRRCSTFQGLSESAVVDLQQQLRLQAFPRGERLLCQGEPARGLHLIQGGMVDVVDTQTGERIDCDSAGSVLGEMSLLTGQPCSAEVVATTDVQALVLSAEDYEDLRCRHPELEIALSQLVSDRLGGRRHDALCGKEIGGYQLVRCISRGGMGVVYEAKAADGSPQTVALKMLRHRFIYDDQMQGRFDLEAKLLEQLLHPNIVTFREHFLAYRTRFLVLDYCDGSDLYRVLRVHGKLDEATVRAIAGQIAAGLRYAHQSGVIHRDLKPGNVLVGRDGHIHLTDFGLSKLIASDVNEGKAVGTPSYMPPEQFRNEQVGPPSDWYALACVMCEMATGRMLFSGCDWSKIFREKRSSQPDEHWPEMDVSDEMREVILGGLAPNPLDRKMDLATIEKWADKVPHLFEPSCDGSGPRPTR